MYCGCWRICSVYAGIALAWQMRNTYYEIERFQSTACLHSAHSSIRFTNPTPLWRWLCVCALSAHSSTWDLMCNKTKNLSIRFDNLWNTCRQSNVCSPLSQFSEKCDFDWERKQANIMLFGAHTNATRSKAILDSRVSRTTSTTYELYARNEANLILISICLLGSVGLAQSASRK